MTELHRKSQESVIYHKCPSILCGARSLADIHPLPISGKELFRVLEWEVLSCRACGSISIWRITKRKSNYDYWLKLVDPVSSSAPSAHPQMPEDVRKDYEEAGRVVEGSPRSAAALLRLALQRLCVHLGEAGNHLDTDIRKLAQRPEFSERLVRAADTLRIIGNNAVHPGRLSDEDVGSVAKGLFDLLNLIVEHGISAPAKWDAMYESLPEGPRREAERKDGRLEVDS